MALDEEALYSLTPQLVATEIAREVSGNTVVDAFCGAGGLTIGLALAGKHVVAIDSSRERLDMARKNADLFGVSESIEFVHGDALEVLPTIQPDTIVLDPPWGGVDYGKIEQFLLSNFAPDGLALLNLALSLTPQVVLRVPKNFQMRELEQFGREYTLQENMLDGKLLHYCVYFGGVG